MTSPFEPGWRTTNEKWRNVSGKPDVNLRFKPTISVWVSMKSLTTLTLTQLATDRDNLKSSKWACQTSYRTLLHNVYLFSLCFTPLWVWTVAPLFLRPSLMGRVQCLGEKSNQLTTWTPTVTKKNWTKKLKLSLPSQERVFVISELLSRNQISLTH